MRGLLESLYLIIHNRVYTRRLRSQKRYADKYVVSIGNLSAGGTGKTPAAILLASHAPSPPLVVLRGYGGTLSREGSLVSDGGTIFSGPREAGDEAVLIARSAPLSVAVDRNRQRAIDRWGRGHKVVLLDDAFQNPTVHRDCDLVLVDSSIAPDRLRVFPWGKFRDPVEALARADVLLLTRTDQSPHVDAWKKCAKEFLAEERIFESAHRPAGIRPPLASRGVGAFCGIGNPGGFFKTVESLGFEIKERRAFDDHAFFTESDLSRLLHSGVDGSDAGKPLPWVTTEKDAVRIFSDPTLVRLMHGHLHVIQIRLEILNGREDDFIRMVYSGPRPDRRRE